MIGKKTQGKVNKVRALRKITFIFTFATLVLSVYALTEFNPRYAAAVSTTINPSNNLPGQISNYTFKFTITSTTLLVVDDVKLTAPAGYDVSGARLVRLEGSWRSGTTLSVAGQVLTLDQPRPSIFKSTVEMVVDLANIRNPFTEGPHTWNIKLFDRDGAAIAAETQDVAITLKNIEIIGSPAGQEDSGAGSGSKAVGGQDLTVDKLKVNTLLTTAATTISSLTPTITFEDTSVGDTTDDGSIKVDGSTMEFNVDLTDGAEMKLTAAGLLTLGGSTLTLNGLTNTVSGGASTLTLTNTGDGNTLTVSTDGASNVVLDADVGVVTGTVRIQGTDDTNSDKLTLGSDTTPVTLAKTAAGTLTVTAATKTILTGALDVGGDISRGAGTLTISNTGANDITVKTTDAGRIVLNADFNGGNVGIVQIEGDGTGSDTLRLGSAATPVTLAKTAAGTLTVTAASGTLLTGPLTVKDSVISSTADTDLSLSGAGAGVVAVTDALKVGGGTAITKITMNQLADGSSGWVPDAAAKNFVITATAGDIKTDSVIVLSLDGNTAADSTCSVADVTAATNFTIRCNIAPADGATLNYTIVNKS